MILERIFLEKRHEADENARRQTNKASYVCHLIEMNYKIINKSLLPEINKELEVGKYLIVPMTTSEYTEKRLYDNTLEMLEELNAIANKKEGSISYPLKTKSIDVTLEYSKYVKDDKNVFYRKELTNRGKKEVNNFREIIGEASIETKIKAAEILKEIKNKI